MTVPPSAISPCLTLATRVIGRHKNNNANSSFVYVINDGLFGCLSLAMITNETSGLPEPKSLIQDEDVDLYPSELWGSSGDDADVVGSGFMLPAMSVSDWLVFEGVGAVAAAVAVPLRMEEAIPDPREEGKW